MADRKYDDAYHRQLAEEKRLQREAAKRREMERLAREAQRREQGRK